MIFFWMKSYFWLLNWLSSLANLRTMALSYCYLKHSCLKFILKCVAKIIIDNKQPVSYRFFGESSQGNHFTVLKHFRCALTGASMLHLSLIGIKWTWIPFFGLSFKAKLSLRIQKHHLCNFFHSLHHFHKRFKYKFVSEFVLTLLRH